MILFTVFDFKIFTVHQPFKLSSAANMLLKLVLEDESLTAVIELLAHYSKTFDRIYDVSSEKDSVTAIAERIGSSAGSSVMPSGDVTVDTSPI